MKWAVWRKRKRQAPATSSVSSRCLRAMMANVSRKIGCIGREHECFIGIEWINRMTIQSLYVTNDSDNLFFSSFLLIFRYLPRAVGLRRIALHKSVSAKGDKMYLLVCECADLLKEISSAAILIPALRARLCGYTGLYRPIQAFWRPAILFCTLRDFTWSRNINVNKFLYY